MGVPSKVALLFGNRYQETVAELVREAVMAGGNADDFLAALHRLEGVQRFIENTVDDAAFRLASGENLYWLEQLATNARVREGFLRRMRGEDVTGAAEKGAPIGP